MHPSPHVPRFYSRQVLEELERLDSLSQHAAKVLQDHKAKEVPDGQLHR